MREYRTTRTTIVETSPSAIPPLPPVRKGRRKPVEAAPAAFKVGDLVVMAFRLVERTTPGDDGEWYVAPIGSTESPISLTIEELRLGMRVPR